MVSNVKELIKELHGLDDKLKEFKLRIQILESEVKVTIVNRIRYDAGGIMRNLREAGYETLPNEADKLYRHIVKNYGKEVLKDEHFSNIIENTKGEIIMNREVIENLKEMHRLDKILQDISVIIDLRKNGMLVRINGKDLSKREEILERKIETGNDKIEYDVMDLYEALEEEIGVERLEEENFKNIEFNVTRITDDI